MSASNVLEHDTAPTSMMVKTYRDAPYVVNAMDDNGTICVKYCHISIASHRQYRCSTAGCSANVDR